MFKVIIFDVDGTILNTDRLYFQILKQELNKIGVSINAREYGINGLDDVIFHIGLDEKMIYQVKNNIYEKYYSDQTTKKIRFKKGALAVIDQLSKNYQLAIGSGEKKEKIEGYLKYLNIDHYFSFIGHGKLVPNRKSNPEYFRKITRFFKVKPKECLVVGDSIFDAEAIKVGCSVVIIPTEFTKYCIFENCFVLKEIKELLTLVKR